MLSWKCKCPRVYGSLCRCPDCGEWSPEQAEIEAEKDKQANGRPMPRRPWADGGTCKQKR